MTDIQSGASQIGSTQRSDRIFETEEAIQKGKMLESDFFEKFVILVDNESLSQRAKLALISVAAMAFDKNAMLANNTDIEMRCLRLEEALNKAKLSYSRPDVMNPAIVYLHENLRQHFRDFVSRSLNMGERRMQAEKRTINESYVSPGEAPQYGGNQQSQRKHGALIEKLLGGNQ